MTGGDFTVEAGGKGMNPETRFTMDGGTLNVTGCDEGIETEKVIVNDGALNIVASDDGINAAVAERSDETEGTVEATAADGETGGDSALDYEYGATVTGGTVILAGSAGMAETFTEGTQPFALVAVSGAAGDTLAIADASGATIAECTVPKAFQCVVVSSPNFTEGGTYQAIVNGAATEFTASTTPTNTVGGMGDRGMGGPGGGRDPRDQRPDSAE